MASYLGFPFDPELFNYNWANAKDPTLTAMFESGAVAPNAELARLIANGSDFYTLPSTRSSAALLRTTMAQPTSP